MRLVGDDELNRSRRAIYINSGSLAGAAVAASYFVWNWLPESTFTKVAIGIFGLFVFAVASIYVWHSTKAIDDYIVMREDYIKNMRP